MSKKSKTYFDQMTMLAFGDDVLLRSVGTRDTMNYACALKITMKVMILPTPIGLNCLDLGVQEALNMRLECIEDLFNIRLVFRKIDPTETQVVINKTNIILVSPRKKH
jgi:hypothetical protein